jgi:hypothetical protein
VEIYVAIIRLERTVATEDTARWGGSSVVAGIGGEPCKFACNNGAISQSTWPLTRRKTPISLESETFQFSGCKPVR